MGQFKTMMMNMKKIIFKTPIKEMRNTNQSCCGKWNRTLNAKQQNSANGRL